MYDEKRDQKREGMLVYIDFREDRGSISVCKYCKANRLEKARSTS